MLQKHVFWTVTAVRKFPGEDLHGLAERIRELYGKNNDLYHLLYGEDLLMLQARLREIDYCVQERGGRYYFNPHAKRYAYHDDLNVMIQDIIDTEKAQHARWHARPKEE